MPAKDLYHDTVKIALIEDGWMITHDPLKLEVGKKDLYVDLGAERLVAAEKAGQKIAVEVKSFLGRSDVDDLEKALGQYVLYYSVLSEQEPERTLYLAIRSQVFENLFEEPIGQLLIRRERLKLLVFDVVTQRILKWIP
jgi:XisH protein